MTPLQSKLLPVLALASWLMLAAFATAAQQKANPKDAGDLPTVAAGGLLSLTVEKSNEELPTASC